MAQKKGEIIVGLDIGTTKICCIVGEKTADGIDVIGIGTHGRTGVKHALLGSVAERVARQAPCPVLIVR